MLSHWTKTFFFSLCYNLRCSQSKIAYIFLVILYIITKYCIQSFYQLVFFCLAQILFFFLELIDRKTRTELKNLSFWVNRRPTTRQFQKEKTYSVFVHWFICGGPPQYQHGPHWQIDFPFSVKKLFYSLKLVKSYFGVELKLSCWIA